MDILYVVYGGLVKYIMYGFVTRYMGIETCGFNWLHCLGQGYLLLAIWVLKLLFSLYNRRYIAKFVARYMGIETFG